MRVLVAPDKFKGSLAAHEVADAIAAGLRPDPAVTAVDSCPIADGGEGFGDALARRFDSLEGILDPLGRTVSARCGWLDAGTAIVETSDASGYHRLASAERNPWRTSTFGTGQIILHAASRGASTILVGLGGSATNDAGAGLAAALGWRFLTSGGEPVDPRPENFLAIERIEAPEDLTLPRIVAACDVRNPLLGPEGASHVYARQKGADDRMIADLELALHHLADLVSDQLGVDFRHLPGAGAAGGLGYGLATFCGGTLQPAFPLVSSALQLEERIAASDLVITGEGRFDAQSLYGKAPMEVARLARTYNKPVALICGQLEPNIEAASSFDQIVSLEELEPSHPVCISNARELVSVAASRIALKWGRRDCAGGSTSSPLG